MVKLTQVEMPQADIAAEAKAEISEGQKRPVKAGKKAA